MRWKTRPAESTAAFERLPQSRGTSIVDSRQAQSGKHKRGGYDAAMQSKAKTVEQYLAELPEDRRRVIVAVRAAILKHLPKGYEEGMQYGMIGYFVPHKLYPAGYHCDPRQPLPFAAIASQKNHISIYLSCLYGSPDHEDWFREAWARTGKKLDMGKCCVRFRKLEDVPLNVIGAAIKRVSVKKFIESYEGAIKRTRGAAHQRKK
jgi:hypothetical protein